MIDIKKSWTFWGGLQNRTDICKFSDIYKSMETLTFKKKLTIGYNIENKLYFGTSMWEILNFGVSENVIISCAKTCDHVSQNCPIMIRLHIISKCISESFFFFF